LIFRYLHFVYSNYKKTLIRNRRGGFIYVPFLLRFYFTF